ncbi:MAG: hypothetical protein ACPG1C_01820 [Alphaproteobacteria bacterium]
MTLEQIYYIAEITAVVGILISLVLVIVQLRHAQEQLRENTRATKINTELGVSALTAEMQKMIIENQPMREALIKARNNDKDMTQQERALYYTYAHMVANAASVNVATHKVKGTIEDITRYHGAATSNALNCDLGRIWVTRNRGMFGDNFAAFLEGMVGLGPLVQPMPPDTFTPPKRYDLVEGAA